MKTTYHTNYHVATHWLGNSLVLCNNIPEVDESVWDNMPPIIDLDSDDEDNYADGKICPQCGAKMEECGFEWECPECGNCEEAYPEVFQWYITDCSEDDVNYLHKTFGLMFTYSDKLDCYILCVPFCGVSWKEADWRTTNENAKRECGEEI